MRWGHLNGSRTHWGLLWGLLGGGFNFFMTRRILKKGLDSKHVLLLVFLKPLTHLIILVLAALVSLWFMVLAAAGDLLMLGVMFLKNYLDGRR